MTGSLQSIREYPLAGLADLHDKIAHTLGTMRLKSLRDSLDDPSIRKHARLDATELQIGKHGIQLLFDEIRADCLDAEDTLLYTASERALEKERS